MQQGSTGGNHHAGDRPDVWSGPVRSPASSSSGISRRTVSIRSTKSSGSCARRSSPTNAASWSSSSATSSSRGSGRSRRPTSSSRSTSAGRSARRERERSVKQLIGRVVDTITRWAREQEYFASEDDLQAFSDDLKHLLVYQKGSFNSPVWFNCGFEKAPQCSACFINSVQDTMESILTLAKTEGMLFKFGSGTGSNLSSIRSSREVLAGGGTASGPGVVHEGLRRVCRRHQVRRQDAPRGEDGHPQRRASRTSSSSSTARSRKRRRPGR